MRRLFLLVAAALAFAACDDGSDAHEAEDALAPASEDGGAMAGDAAPALDAGLSSRPDAAQGNAGGLDGGRTVPCVDEQFAALMLLEAPASGAIREEGPGTGVFETYIDATAGGMPASQSFVYARFAETGLEKVEVGDEDAFTSTAWQIAFRRYIIRLNSGVSGPGDVRVARTAPMTDFDALSSVPPELAYRIEQYFTESCEFVSDTSGIGAPATALSSFWSYAGCLAMTGDVFVLELPGGRHVKLQVRAYYPLENQRQCDETDSVSQPTGAGNLRIRWAFLD